MEEHVTYISTVEEKSQLTNRHEPGREIRNICLRQRTTRHYVADDSTLLELQWENLKS
jgi:hypothetical protein